MKSQRCNQWNRQSGELISEYGNCLRRPETKKAAVLPQRHWGRFNVHLRLDSVRAIHVIMPAAVCRGGSAVLIACKQAAPLPSDNCGYRARKLGRASNGSHIASGV